MEESESELEIRTSFINWLDPLEDGFCALIAITLNNSKSYEGIYWLNENNESLAVDPEFLIMFEVDYEEDLPFYFDLLEDIRTIIPTEFPQSEAI